MISRRDLLKNAALAGALLGTPPMFGQSTTPVYSTRTLDLVQNSTVIDMLGLLTLDFHKLYSWQHEPEKFQSSDFQKLKDSGITVFHPAVGHDEGDIHANSLRDMTLWNNFLSKQGEYFVRIDGTADLAQVKASGKIGILLGEQNSAHFRSVEDVDAFHGLGQRVSQLTYSGNRIGCGAGELDKGLTCFGGEVVARMNRVGMAVDVSHCGDRTTMEALEASKKPVLITHSNCRALVPKRSRCKTDEVIRKMAAGGGVMGISLIRSFVKAEGPTTVEHVLDHIDRVAKLVGVEHLGLGTDVDLDGRAKLRLKDLRAQRVRSAANTDLDGINYQKKIYDVTEGLVRRQYSDRNIGLILGGNFSRVLSQIWTA
jgi:membrane dipeptidase